MNMSTQQKPRLPMGSLNNVGLGGSEKIDNPLGRFSKNGIVGGGTVAFPSAT